MKIPKYVQIKQALEQEILSGKFANGDKFYSENDLIQKYDVSSITVIRAIQELVQEGFLVRHQGKGTFVSRSRKRVLVEFSDIEFFDESEDSVEVLSVKRWEDEVIREKLGLQKNEPYYQLIRRRSVNQEHYFLQFSYIPEKYLAGDLSNPTYYESIYHRFKMDVSINPNEQLGTETNEICFPTPLEIATILNITPETPTVLQKKLTTLKDSGDVIEYIESYKKWDYYKIEFTSFSPN